MSASSEPSHSPSSDASNEQEDGAALGLDAALEFLAELMSSLGVQPMHGFLHESSHYAMLKQLPCIVRSGDYARVDGAHYLGDLDLSNLNYAERLQHILSEPNSRLHKSLALQDSKFLGFGLDRCDSGYRGAGTAVVRSDFHLSDVQLAVVSHLHLAFAGAPGMTVLLPVDDEARSVAFRHTDILLHHMPIPPKLAPLAFPLNRLRQAHISIDNTYRNGTEYIVPVSNVVVTPWAQRLSSDKTVLEHDGPASEAFTFLYHAISVSAYAQARKIRVDLAEFQPFDGDAKLYEANQVDPCQSVELKYNLFHQREDYIQVMQLGLTPQDRKRRSMFHPYRGWHFLVLFYKDYEYVYWIPAAFIRAEWWTEEYYVDIQLDHIRDFRVEIQGNTAWIREVYERIVDLHARSQRPPHKVSAGVLAADYHGGMEQELGEAWAGSQRKGIMLGYPWWKIERWNRGFADAGYGVFLPLGRHQKFANVFFVGVRWSVQDQIVYRATGLLPVQGHVGDISPYAPVLLFKAICANHYRRYFSPEFSSHVNGLKLDPGPFPVLYYVDCDTFALRGEERSGLLFPSEFVDYEYLRGVYSEKCGKSVNTAREFFDKSDRNKYETITFLTRLTDLRKCLTAPVGEFMIREGREFHTHVRQFLDAHVSEEKLVSWFDHSSLYAKADYMIHFRDLLQELGNLWIPKLLKGRALDEDEDDEDVDDDE